MWFMIGALGHMLSVQISQELDTKGINSTSRRDWKQKVGSVSSMCSSPNKTLDTTGASELPWLAGLWVCCLTLMLRVNIIHYSMEWGQLEPLRLDSSETPPHAPSLADSILHPLPIINHNYNSFQCIESFWQIIETGCLGEPLNLHLSEVRRGF